MYRTLTGIAIFALLLNGFAFYMRYQYRSTLNFHKVQRFGLLVSNILCCVACLIVEGQEITIDSSLIQNASYLDSHFHLKCQDFSSNFTLYNETEIHRDPIVTTINKISNDMVKDDLCFLWIKPMFYMVKVGYKPLLGNTLSHPLYIINAVFRILMAASSLYKVISVKLFLRQRQTREDPIKLGIINISILIAGSLLLNVCLFGIIFFPSTQMAKKHCLGGFVALLLYFALLCKLVAVVWSLNMNCKGRDEEAGIEQKTETRSADSGTDEPGYQSWQDLAPSSLQQLPSTNKLNLITPRSVVEPQPTQTRSTGITWNALPKKLQEIIKEFQWVVFLYILSHLLAFLFTFIMEYESILKRKIGDLSIRWVILFVDCVMMIFCWEEFFILLTTSKWRKRVKWQMHKLLICICECCLCGGSEPDEPQIPAGPDTIVDTIEEPLGGTVD